jgi:hypothetical protein
VSAAEAVAPCQRCASALEADDLRCPICGLATPRREPGAVERERARLLRPRRIRGLARSLDELRREARSPARAYPLHRTLFSRAVVRQVDAELEQTAELLRGAVPEPAAVARTERLLSGGRSPLYGEDTRRLREELEVILFALRGGTG